MTDVTYTKPTYNDIHNWCLDIIDDIGYSGTNIERVVGISRGGLIPGVIISHQLNLPFTAVAYSSKLGNGDNKNHANELPVIKERDILIVDDICDTAHTLNDVVTHYRGQGHNVTSAVLHYKRRANGIFKPDVCCVIVPEDSEWIVYPFEKVDML